MLYLSAAEPQGDPVALGMVLVLALIAAIMALRKYLAQRKPAPVSAQQPAVAPDAAPVPTPQRPKAPGSAGKLKLHNVEPKTAAMIMAITANKMGKPLNELRIISIKEVTNQ